MILYGDTCNTICITIPTIHISVTLNVNAKKVTREHKIITRVRKILSLRNYNDL